MNKRTVEVYKNYFNNEKEKYERKVSYTGVFHSFGVDFMEFETGPGNYSTAIVEMPDGSVQNVPVDMIKFVSPMEPK